ncbi:putative PurR-regulated permease PerM [Endobacter medicaginis]|nr:putative PurR-regulated permease PerM [Endobacter medicaginis]
MQGLVPDGEGGAADDYPPPELQRAREMLARSSPSVPGVCLLLLTILATFYTLYFAAAIVLPFVLAGVLNLLLMPPMRLLNQKLRIPKPISALLLILLLFGIVGMIGLAISVPASGWISKAPQTLPALQQKLAFLRGPIDAAQHAMGRLQAMVQGTAGGGAHQAAQHGDGGLVGPMSSLGGIGSSLLIGTRAFLAQIFTTLLMLFFLLYEGDSLLRRFIEIMPTWADKRRAVQIASEVEHNVSLYLLTITIMNLLVGGANMIQCWALGMPNALLWGVVAFLLNYIPILGPMTGIVIYFVVGLFSFPSVLHALIPPAIYLGIHFLEGETITPMLLARRFTLNPVLVMASLMFWDWLWGIPGAFLSVPMLAVFKIVCDHIEALTPIGHIIGGAPKPRGLERMRRREPAT